MTKIEKTRANLRQARKVFAETDKKLERLADVLAELWGAE